MAERRVRVRFAPSPTGPLHIGGVRTALYNYLFARQHGGDLVFRIEDTDTTRFVPEAEAYIIEAFRWLGIRFDEGVSFGGNYGPYRQSERRDIYKKYVDLLLQNGKAYIAFDTPEELEQKRQEIENFQYDNRTRLQMRNSLTLPQDEVQRLISEGRQYVVRFKIDAGQEVLVDDMIRGEVRVKSDILDDKVLYKSADQLPTYHLANIVDDHLMEITEVIRGEEWLPSLPLHYLLYEAFGWQDSQPRFAHLSLLLKPDGKGKLSKRDGDRLGFPVFPLRWVNAEGEVSRGYREDGYYPEAFVNMLAFLGWNPGTEQEIFSLEELVKVFSLERVVKSGARFNPDKARWFNQEYLRMRPTSQLVADFRASEGRRIAAFSDDYVGAVLDLMRERVHFPTEFREATSFFFEAPASYDPAAVAKFWKDDIPTLVPQVRDIIAAIGPFDKEHIETVETRIRENGWPMGKVMNTLRLFLVGRSVGPGVADMMAILGKDEVLRRIDKGIVSLK